MKFAPAGNLRPKNYTAANSILIAAQDAIELARRWGGGLVCQTIAITWYALHDDPAGDVRRRRLHAPWYPTKRDPSMLDILASLRRELIRTGISRTSRPQAHTRANQPALATRGRRQRTDHESRVLSSRI